MEDIVSILDEKLSTGEGLLDTLAQMDEITGKAKLERKIKQEIKFLRKLRQDGVERREQVTCSNLLHFHALVQCLESCSEPVGVLQRFLLHNDENSRKRVIVDVVAQGGREWIKVVARNPKALHLLSMGEGGYGQRTILDTASDYLMCSAAHPYLFQCPRVTFRFSCGITASLASTLESSGVSVWGAIIPDTNPMAQVTQSDPPPVALPTPIKRLNLDVTTLVAYVSSLCNGNSSLVFRESVLTQQAEWERLRPVKPVLDDLFSAPNCVLLVCRAALDDFQQIVGTVGGPLERSRAEEFLERVAVVDNQPSERAMKLCLGGKVKRRSILVFGTGDQLQAITVTANARFVHAARGQGVDFNVFIHESRALAEEKEKDAEALP